MTEQISFIHAADLHLDSPFLGLSQVPESIFNEIQESTFVALDRLVTTAINKKVDFVLLVGDLFDNEKQSLKAQIRLRQAFEKLRDHHINVYASYGNHDFMNGNVHPVTYPENVNIFKDEEITHFTYEKNGKALANIYGFSYEERAVTSNKAMEFKRVNEEVPLHIAMLHGCIQTNTEHDRYAPFHLSDLLKQSFDYWALGHIHKRQVWQNQVPIVYPGNTQGRHRNEAGEKGCYYVTLSREKSELTFIPLHALTFKEICVDVSTCEDIYQLESKLQTSLRAEKDVYCPQLIDLTLISDHPILAKWKNEQLLDELIEIMNEPATHERNWAYIYRYTTKVNKTWDHLAAGDHFVSQLLQEFSETEIQPALTDLFDHRQGRKYLHLLSKEEQESIRQEAEQLLMNELINIEGD